MAEEKKDGEGGKKITIYINDANGGSLTIKAKTTTTFGKVKKAFAKNKGVDENIVRLLLDGTRLNDNQSAEDLNIAYDNPDAPELKIDAMVRQDGGGSGSGGSEIQSESESERGSQAKSTVQ